jgi:O-antigen/teichoic acid export membrane protein
LGAVGLGALPVFVLAARMDTAGPPTPAPTGALLSYGLRGHFGTVFQSLNYRLDFFLIAVLLSSRDVGIYSVAVTAAETLWVLPNALGAVITYRAAASPPDEANRVTGLATRVAFGFMVAAALFWAAAGREAIPLIYGDEFSSAVVPLLWLLPGVVALGVWKNVMNDLVGRGHSGPRSSTAGLALGVTLGLAPLLIDAYGVSGAAMASSAAYVLTCVLGVVIFARATGARPVDLLAPRRRDVAEVTAMVRNLRPSSPSPPGPAST